MRPGTNSLFAACLLPLATLSTAVPVAEVSLSTTWTSLGCYVDSVASRSLGKRVNTLGGIAGLTVKVCQATCDQLGFALAGVEFGGECYCDNSIRDGRTIVSSNQCSTPCTGDKTQTCGAADRINIYAAAALSTTSGAWTYTSCYADSVTARILPVTAQIQGVMAKVSIETCTATCQSLGYKLAGLEFASECYCGDTLRTKSKTSSGCDMPCRGNAGQICGGSNRLSLYTYTGWSAVGCYTDTVTRRTLGTRPALSYNTMTIEICQNACAKAGFTLAGLEYGGECYCDNAYHNGGVPVKDGCTMSCNGDRTKICGGSNRLSVYKLTAIAPPRVPTSTSTLPVVKPSSTNVCVSALQLSSSQAARLCSHLQQNMPASTSTTTIHTTSTSVSTEHTTSTANAPGHAYVTTTAIVYKGAYTTVTVDATSVATHTSVVVTTLVEVVPGSIVTQVVTTTLESEETVPVTVTETLVESSTVTLTQTSVSTLFDFETSTATALSTVQTTTETNSVLTTVSNISSTTVFGVTVTTGIPTATVTTTGTEVSTFTEVVTSTVVETEFAVTETLTSFTSTAVSFVATSTQTIIVPLSAQTIISPFKKRDLNLHDRAAFPDNVPGCSNEAAVQACKSLGLWSSSYDAPTVIITIRVVVVVDFKVRIVVYLYITKPETITVTKTVSNILTATATRTQTVTSGVLSTSRVRSVSTLLGATLSSTLSVSHIQTVLQTATATTLLTAVSTTETTVIVSTTVPTVVVATITVLLTTTTTIDQTFTSIVSDTATIDSPGETLIVTEYVTATDTATITSVITESSTSTTSETTSETTSTTKSDVTTASATFVTSCTLGETLPTPNAVINPGFESNADGQPWTFSVPASSIYTASFAVGTSLPAFAGCQAGVITLISTSKVTVLTATLKQTVATTPGKTYQIGYSYRIQLPPGQTRASASLIGSFGSENFPSLNPLASGAWQSFTTPVVAFSPTTNITLSFTWQNPNLGTYLLLLDEVFVTEVNDNGNLIVNGGFDNYLTSAAPWTTQGDGTFALATSDTSGSGVVRSAPNAGVVTLHITKPLSPSTPLVQSVRQRLTGLVVGTTYKTTLNFDVEATYVFPVGAKANPSNGAYIYVQYPDAPAPQALIIVGFAQSNSVTYTMTFTALYKRVDWIWQGYAALSQPSPAVFTLDGTVKIYADNLYVVRDTTVR